MALSGKISDLKLLIALFGNIPIKEILQMKTAFKMTPDHQVA